MAFFRCNRRTYTREEVENTGEMHGSVGLLFYPPSVWGTDSGWGHGARAPHLRAMAGLAELTPDAPDVVYWKAYCAGRRRWFEYWGCFHEEGCDFWDEEIRHAPVRP